MPQLAPGEVLHVYLNISFTWPLATTKACNILDEQFSTSSNDQVTLLKMKSFLQDLISSAAHAPFRNQDHMIPLTNLFKQSFLMCISHVSPTTPKKDFLFTISKFQPSFFYLYVCLKWFWVSTLFNILSYIFIFKLNFDSFFKKNQ